MSRRSGIADDMLEVLWTDMGGRNFCFGPESALIRVCPFKIRCALGHFLWRMRARVCWVTDARKNLTFSDGCAQWFFEERMRARVGVSPGCAQPTWQMRATPRTRITRKSDYPSPGHTTSFIGVKVVCTFKAAGFHIGSYGLIDFWAKLGYFPGGSSPSRPFIWKPPRQEALPGGWGSRSELSTAYSTDILQNSKQSSKRKLAGLFCHFQWKQTFELWLRALLRAFENVTAGNRWLLLLLVTVI